MAKAQKYKQWTVKTVEVDRGSQRAILAKKADADRLWAFRYVPLLPPKNQRFLPKKRESRPRLADGTAAMSCARHAASHNRFHHNVLPTNWDKVRLRRQYRNGHASALTVNDSLVTCLSAEGY